MLKRIWQWTLAFVTFLILIFGFAEKTRVSGKVLQKGEASKALKSTAKEWPSLLQKNEVNIKKGKSLNVLFVTAEFVGLTRNGGIGTALTALAESLALKEHKVTVLFTEGGLPGYDDIYQQWVEYYRMRKIEIVGLHQRWDSSMPKALVESFEVTYFLRERKYDIVHCHDYRGACYYSLLMKKQGLPQLSTTVFILGVHGPTMWAKKIGNQEIISDIKDLEIDHMEKKCVELADYIVSPSQYLVNWMKREGWSLNANTFVQPNVLPKADRHTKKSNKAKIYHVRELVFFGRLETRKGVVLFIQAFNKLLSLQKLLKIEKRVEKVTFMGRSGMVLGSYGKFYVQGLAQKWGEQGIQWQIIEDYGPEEAKAYLSENDSRLAVIPSRIENSPFTVIECAERGIPFIASRVGGIIDLVHPDDHDRVLFDPIIDALVSKLLHILKFGITSARPRVNAEENEEQWISWHHKISRNLAKLDVAKTNKKLGLSKTPFVSVVLATNNLNEVEESVKSILQQSYPQSSFELILINSAIKGSDSFLSLQERYTSEFSSRGWSFIQLHQHQSVAFARNMGSKKAKGKYILFMDEKYIANSVAIEEFVKAMEHCKADVLTSFIDIYESEIPPKEYHFPTYIYLGGSKEIGAFKNCFGGSSAFIRKDILEKLGGYSESEDAGFLDWEFLANASISGYTVDVVPRSLQKYKLTNLQSTDEERHIYAVKSRQRSLKPYLKRVAVHERSIFLDAIFPKNTTNGNHIFPSDGLAAQSNTIFPGMFLDGNEIIRFS